MIKILLLANLASTFFMIGLIWFVQIVHYPLFERVGRDGFAAYESAHSQLTSLVVIPPMLVELVTTVMLVLVRPAGIRLSEAVAGAVLLAVVWGSTFFHIGRPEQNIWAGTRFRPVPFLREASFILLTGLIPGRYSLGSYSELFLEARLMELPMICANP
ncbi:MAG: hypothetical protein EBU88_10340, partial [Acidobacteria bacterium]|nr:hypothetical protein [Acidobacteriota bacterium]